MLILWHSQLVPKDQQLLLIIDPQVSFWPGSYFRGSEYNVCIPVEWWISFSRAKYGFIWLLAHSEHSRVVYSS